MEAEFDAYWDTQAKPCPSCQRVCPKQAFKLRLQGKTTTTSVTVVGWSCDCGWKQVTDGSKPQIQVGLDSLRLDEKF